MKKYSALQQLIDRLKKMSTDAGDNDVSKAYHEGLQWAIFKATELLEVERQDLIKAFDEGTDHIIPVEGQQYFEQTFTQ